MRSQIALALVADGRWPSGGHAHSGGLEAAVRAGLVTDAETLHGWLLGRLMTTGEVDAAFASVAWMLAAPADPAAPPTGSPRTYDGCWTLLIDEYWARVPVPALRAASMALGRAALRSAAATWPLPERLRPTRPNDVDWPWPVAFGAAARASGMDRAATALALATASVQGPAWSATRLMGLDPYQVARSLAQLVGAIETVTRRASQCDMDSLPSISAPLLDIGAGNHSNQEVRLFAS